MRAETGALDSRNGEDVLSEMGGGPARAVVQRCTCPLQRALVGREHACVVESRHLHQCTLVRTTASFDASTARRVRDLERSNMWHAGLHKLLRTRVDTYAGARLNRPLPTTQSIREENVAGKLPHHELRLEKRKRARARR